jgi:glycerol-3-phosphate dehydrogenase
MGVFQFTFSCELNTLCGVGLAGVGDLVLTCTGELSRNRTVGLRLGQVKPQYTDWGADAREPG